MGEIKKSFHPFEDFINSLSILDGFEGKKESDFEENMIDEVLAILVANYPLFSFDEDYRKELIYIFKQANKTSSSQYFFYIDSIFYLTMQYSGNSLMALQTTFIFGMLFKHLVERQNPPK